LHCTATLPDRSFRYWLPEQEAVWRSDPLWLLEEQARQDRALIEQITGLPFSPDPDLRHEPKKP
jgi:hypothetical protein